MPRTFLTRLRLSAARALAAAAAALLAAAPAPAQAGDRLLATWGVAEVEGAAGGGLTPWAVITGTGSANQIGASAYATHMRSSGGFVFDMAGAGLGLYERWEFTVARWNMSLSDTVPGESLHMDVLGAKVRLAGNAVYDQDSWLPQISAGLQYKHNRDFHAVPAALGALHASDTELYLSATKLWLAALQGRNLLGNLTLRTTRANQFGLLGFGGPQGDGRSLKAEGSLGLMLTDNLVVGAEYRSKPDNLASFKEQSAWDVFGAWFPCRHLSLTAAWVDLGNIANKPHQNGLYLSAQMSY